LKSISEWKKLCKSKKKPKNIPVNPHLTYKEYGWTNYADFLGYMPRGTFMPFLQARKFVRSLGFTATGQWKQYCHSGKRPKDIPCQPEDIYEGQYQGLRDWIGLPKERFLPFAEAKKYVRSLGLRRTDWPEWCKTKRPSNIPSRPHTVYEGKGWKGWADWFGNYRGNRKEFLSYRKARALARTLEIKKSAEWQLLCKQGGRPKNIPSCPNKYYKEFLGYADFFGYKSRRGRRMKTV
jgi:hypothetical protein